MIAFIVYLIVKLYPFYQRYWASCLGDGCDSGKKYVNNLETIAYGLSFDEAEKLANELKKPGPERKDVTIEGAMKYGTPETLPATPNQRIVEEIYGN